MTSIQIGLHETKGECDRCGHEGYDVFAVGSMLEPYDLCRSCISDTATNIGGDADR